MRKRTSSGRARPKRGRGEIGHRGGLFRDAFVRDAGCFSLPERSGCLQFCAMQSGEHPPAATATLPRFSPFDLVVPPLRDGRSRGAQAGALS